MFFMKKMFLMMKMFFMKEMKNTQLQIQKKLKQCKVTSKNKKKKTAFVKFYLEDGLSKQKKLVNLSDFIVVEEEKEFDY